MFGMLKQSVDKTVGPAIRFVLCSVLGRKVSNLVVGRREAWKDGGACIIIGHCETNDGARKEITSRLCILEVNRYGKTMEKCFSPSSSTVLDFPIPAD